MENKIYMTLPIPLTEEEQIELGQRVADLEIKCAEVEAKKNEANVLFNKEIKALNAETLKISQQIKAGTKNEEVECYWNNDDPKSGKKTLYRFDTGDALETVDMTLFDGVVEEEAN